MPNYFYFDQLNQKRGPVTEQQLQALATQGVIGPHTPLETEGGHKGMAGQIPGMQFNTAPHTPTSPTTQAMPSSGFQSKGIAMTAVAVLLVIGLLWLLYTFFMSSNPMIAAFKSLKYAKSGDRVKYEVAVSNPGGTEKFHVEQKVISNDGKKVKIRTTITNPFGGEEEHEEEIDLSKWSKCRSYKDMIELALDELEEMPKEMKEIAKKVLEKSDLKVTTGKKSRSTMSVAGSSFNCAVVPYNISASYDNVSFSVQDIRTWTAKNVPLGGLVKAEWEISFPYFDWRKDKVTTGNIGITITLSEYSSSR